MNIFQIRQCNLSLLLVSIILYLCTGYLSYKLSEVYMGNKVNIEIEKSIAKIFHRQLHKQFSEKNRFNIKIFDYEPRKSFSSHSVIHKPIINIKNRETSRFKHKNLLNIDLKKSILDICPHSSIDDGIYTKINLEKIDDSIYIIKKIEGIDDGIYPNKCGSPRLSMINE